jgi:hypothetical protein
MSTDEVVVVLKRSEGKITKKPRFGKRSDRITFVSPNYGTALYLNLSHKQSSCNKNCQRCVENSGDLY